MMKRSNVLFAVLLAGCGSEGPGTSNQDLCGFGSDRYLPYEPGFAWTYLVTDVETGERKTKEQRLEEEIADPTYGPVIVQTTGKLAGSTRSLVRVEGDRVVRLQQEDLDSAGAIERTTVYDPGQIRIDESPERMVEGATWQEGYAETFIEPSAEPLTIATTDVWEVLGVDVACESPAGSFACIHLRRTRTEGGVAVKDFLFARGIGKVRETGDNQVEELVECGQ